MSVRRGKAPETDAGAPAKGGVEAAPGPRGVGTAVAFDWAIAAELLVVAALVAAGAGSFGAPLASRGLVPRLAVAAATLVAGVPVFALGEALRSGWRLARPAQVVFNAALAVYGVVQLPDAVRGVRAGHYSGVPRSVYLLVVCPLIVWWLTRPRTKRWFRATTTAAARSRHGSARWLLTIAIIAVAGGHSVALGDWY